ncbi:unnamed protein product [Paramecium sonneborni]|uniref:Transmembrane protein n=1 Tax=Paramecium sonneborni TaxID=65129 RepID=A0A8S1R0A1_9CILI|nr:unnamed protein product [Paramecium sonneborni]
MQLIILIIFSGSSTFQKFINIKSQKYLFFLKTANPKRGKPTIQAQTLEKQRSRALHNIKNEIKAPIRMIQIIMVGFSLGLNDIIAIYMINKQKQTKVLALPDYLDNSSFTFGLASKNSKLKINSQNCNYAMYNMFTIPTFLIKQLNYQDILIVLMTIYHFKQQIQNREVQYSREQCQQLFQYKNWP